MERVAIIFNMLFMQTLQNISQFLGKSLKIKLLRPLLGNDIIMRHDKT